VIETVLLVPGRDNDGKPFPPSAWDALEAALLRFGGYTRQADVTGAWSLGERIYRDRSRQYVVSLGSWRDLPAWLKIVEWTRSAFRHEALYVKIAGIPEVIGPPRPGSA
jgi:hypothetical protein